MGEEVKFEIRATAELKAEIPADVQRDVVGFAQRVFGPIAELGDLLSDRVRLLRLRQAMSVLKQAKEMCAEAGIEPKRIPLNVLVPLLERASLEGDESDSLRSAWAALLANAAKSPEKKYAKYVSILEEIDFSEAQLLSELKTTTSRHELFKPDSIRELVNREQEVASVAAEVQRVEDLRRPGRLGYHWHEDDIPNTNEFSFADLDEVVPLLHLHSLSLIKLTVGSFLAESGSVNKRIFYLYSDLTPLGFDFVAACEKPEG